MPLARLLSLAILVSLLPTAFAQREFGFDNRKASGQPYLKPEESVARTKVADGFEVKLFAAEPQIVNPIAMTVDEKGRVWVVECFEYPKRTAKGKMPRDRIKILEDTDGDGVCDKVTTFIEGKDFPVPFDLASGIEVGNGGVYLGAPPYLFFIENKNDKPGKIEILLKGFGSQDTHETLNTFQWGPDGRLYGLHGVFTYSEVKPGEGDGPTTRLNAAIWRYDTRTKKFEVFAEGTSNPWGMDWRNTDGQFILCCCVIPHLFHIVPGGNYKRQAGQGSNPYAYGEIKEICDHTFHKESGWAHAGLISLDTPLMPEKYRNSVIFGSIHGCSIKQNILKPNGSSFTASQGDDFLVSGDKNFRPINLRWGPNGEIYCIDWHDQNPCSQANPDSWDYEHGRVYRIQTKGLKTKKAEDLSKKDPFELYKLFDDPNPYMGRTALRLLQEKGKSRIGDTSKWPFLTNKVLCGCLADTVGVPEPRPGESPAQKHDLALRFFLEDPDPKTIADRIAGLTPHFVGDGTDCFARREIASAMVRHSRTLDVTAMVRALATHGEDATDPVIPQLIWTAYEPSLVSKPSDELNWLKDHAERNPLITDTIIPRAMRRLVATGKREDLGLCLNFAVQLTDSGVRAKALDALVTAIGNRLLDAPAEWEAARARLYEDETPDVRRLTNRLAIKFHDVAALRFALKVAQEELAPLHERISAVRDLGVARSPEAIDPLLRLARGPGPAELRAEAVRSLGGFDAPKLASDLLADWANYSPPLRNEVVQVLAGRKDWAADLLKAVGEKKVDRMALNDNTILRIQALKDKRLNAEVEKVWGRIRATPAELNRLIDKMRGELSTAPGSFNRGRLVFDNQCAKCHKFDGRGSEVGPNIEGGGRDIEYLLINVLDPNRVIGAPYFMRTVNLLNGRVETGVLAAEDDQSITLKTENAVLKQIQKKDIDDIKVQEKSLMPEGLANNMSVQDFRDLVRYVMAHPFLTDVTVQVGDKKTKPVVGVSGRIPLPEAKGPVRIEAEVTAPEDMRTRLLLGVRSDFTVSINGSAPKLGKGSGAAAAPDQVAVEVELSRGMNRLVIEMASEGRGEAVFGRFWDPDRKLRYPDVEVAPKK
ncbi:MAG: c-type cytochrome [Zavarzinella sp.]|nr:c-type cytochrome [Zavarzinella sp.]